MAKFHLHQSPKKRSVKLGQEAVQGFPALMGLDGELRIEPLRDSFLQIVNQARSPAFSCRIKRLESTRNFGSKIKHRFLELRYLFFSVFRKNSRAGDSISIHKISCFVEHLHGTVEKGIDSLYQRVYDNFVEPGGLTLAELLSCACSEGIDGECKKCQELKERNRYGNPAKG